MAKTRWDIRNRGRAWLKPGEAMQRFELAPEKIEMVRAKILANHRQRRTMLALLLENVGADAAVRLGDPVVWRRAVARLDNGQVRSPPSQGGAGSQY